MSLTKKDKDKKKDSIAEIINHGSRKNFHDFLFYYKKREEKIVAIIIPKKITKNAVDRNKIRRRIREIIRNEEYYKKYNFVIKVKENLIKKKCIYLRKKLKIEII